MSNLYNESKIINKDNVSIQSAFICMLHLANEKGLFFTMEGDNQSTNADFIIEMK
jgi:hypothetical protein